MARPVNKSLAILILTLALPGLGNWRKVGGVIYDTFDRGWHRIDGKVIQILGRNEPVSLEESVALILDVFCAAGDCDCSWDGHALGCWAKMVAAAVAKRQR